jgi:HD-like signal output (HDOD) protein
MVTVGIEMAQGFPSEVIWERKAPAPPWLNVTNFTVPVLPVIATRLVSMAADPEVPILELAKIISKDQVLASRLLGLANSAFFAAVQPVTTVTEAIVRVGANGVRNMVVTVCFSSQLYDQNIYGAQGRALVDHGIGTAYVSRLIAERIDEPEDEVFLGGLLHDIGKLLILRQAFDHRRRTGAQVPPEELAAALDTYHAHLGGLLVQRWRLPEALEEPVRLHHDWTQAVEPGTRTRLVYLANRLSHRYGFGCDPDAYNLTADPVFREFGLDAEWLTEVDGRAPGLFDVARTALA